MHLRVFDFSVSKGRKNPPLYHFWRLRPFLKRKVQVGEGHRGVSLSVIGNEWNVSAGELVRRGTVTYPLQESAFMEFPKIYINQLPWMKK